MQQRLVGNITGLLFTSYILFGDQNFNCIKIVLLWTTQQNNLSYFTKLGWVGFGPALQNLMAKGCWVCHPAKTWTPVWDIDYVRVVGPPKNNTSFFLFLLNSKVMFMLFTCIKILVETKQNIFETNKTHTHKINLLDGLHYTTYYGHYEK